MPETLQEQATSYQEMEDLFLLVFSMSSIEDSKTIPLSLGKEEEVLLVAEQFLVKGRSKGEDKIL
jgi:hypothetical protein